TRLKVPSCGCDDLAVGLVRVATDHRIRRIRDCIYRALMVHMEPIRVPVRAILDPLSNKAIADGKVLGREAPRDLVVIAQVGGPLAGTTIELSIPTSTNAILENKAICTSAKACGGHLR